MPKSKTPKVKKEKSVSKKAVPKRRKAEKPPEAKKTAKLKYFESTGRRKTAIARVRISEAAEKTVLINGKTLENYFPTFELRETVISPLKTTDSLKTFQATVRVRGGGINAQAEAVRHGIAKALVLFNPEFRLKLKKTGFLTRDPRMRERKKFGLKRARRAPQWQKR